MLRRLLQPFRRVTASGNYLPEVDGLRFVAIVWVVLLHAYGFFLKKSGPFTEGLKDYPLLDYILMRGAFGVDMFFTISGFVLALPFARHALAGGKEIRLGSYYKRRLIRFEPPYFICMLIGFGVHVRMHPEQLAELSRSLGASLLYLHQIIFHRLSPINSPTWSLEYEIQFYLLAPLLFRSFRLSPAARRIMWSIVYVIVSVLLQYWHPPFKSVLNVFPFFIAGIVLADVYISYPALKLDQGWVLLLAIGVALTLLLCPWTPLFWQTAPLLLFFFYMAVLRHPLLKRLFSTPLLATIGGMCYSIYLVHYYCISVAGAWIIRLHAGSGFLPNLLLQMTLLLLSALAGSALFFLLAERPFMKWSAKLRH
jgi:peptidoglycan/LPS O-acetylase OafA/YrhL